MVSTSEKRLAKFLVQQSVRNNTSLEALHRGTFPSSKAGDYSDVKVVSPYGEIPWTGLSRISDEEMKQLMREVVRNTYAFLCLLADPPPRGFIMRVLEGRDFVANWDDPTVDLAFQELILKWLATFGGAAEDALDAARKVAEPKE